MGHPYPHKPRLNPGLPCPALSPPHVRPMHIPRDALRPIWAFPRCFRALTIPHEFIRPCHQLLKLFRYGLLPHDSFMTYNGPNGPLPSPSLLPLLYTLRPPIHQCSHTLRASQRPKSTVPCYILASISPRLLLPLLLAITP